jgi:hypothetical protein
MIAEGCLMSDDYVARVRTALADYGIRDFRIERTRRHRRIVVAGSGRRITVVIPSTGSD